MGSAVAAALGTHTQLTENISDEVAIKVIGRLQALVQSHCMEDFFVVNRHTKKSRYAKSAKRLMVACAISKTPIEDYLTWVSIDWLPKNLSWMDGRPRVSSMLSEKTVRKYLEYKKQIPDYALVVGVNVDVVWSYCLEGWSAFFSACPDAHTPDEVLSAIQEHWILFPDCWLATFRSVTITPDMYVMAPDRAGALVGLRRNLLDSLGCERMDEMLLHSRGIVLQNQG